MNHVNKYGPRDWSSIRSKGLLCRTGKSCRLRWVNKLRPNLKNGCKFSLEEERIVIELQEQFGNKWARISTYLPGRTDNDVKNFWSSRKKRLARMLQAKHTSPSSPLPAKQSNSGDTLRYLPLTWEIANEASSSTQVDEQPSCVDQSREMLLPPGPIDPCLIHYNPNLLPLEMMAPEKSMNVDCPAADFPIQVPFAPTMPVLPVPLSPESQELVARLDNGCLTHGFEQEDGTGSVDPEMMFSQELPQQNSDVGGENNLAAPDSFFDDFPADMFDHIESLPSPSNWRPIPRDKMRHTE
uniref:Uncharacterized protein n=1 Tax=Kalanchoe fedtschenkoi TaxID=63787 RepID=A0A7N1A2P4_KALFE